MIRPILANFELVKCCLLYFSGVNIYNQMKAGSLFYLPGKKLKVARKNCSVERIFRERTLTHISRNYSTMNYCTNVIISDCPFYFVHFHHNFEGIELK